MADQTAGKPSNSYAFHYRVQHDEPVLYVEIYLPKRAELQGALFRALTAGFKLREVRSHFRNLHQPGAQPIFENVEKMTKMSWAVLNKPLDEQEIDRFPRLFFGYSMYEVDGVYLRELAQGQETESQEDDADENYEMVQETTQVIRLVFKYPSAGLPLEIIGHIKAMLRDPYADISRYKENYSALEGLLKDSSGEQVEEQVEKVKQWVRYIGWFIYGYLMYQICDEIAKIHKEQKEAQQRSRTRHAADRQAATVKQDEIWLTSLWHMNINVIVWDDRVG